MTSGRERISRKDKVKGGGMLGKAGLCAQHWKGKWDSYFGDQFGSTERN